MKTSPSLIDRRLEIADAIYDRCFRIWRAIAILLALLVVLSIVSWAEWMGQVMFVAICASFVPGVGMVIGFFAGVWLRWRS